MKSPHIPYPAASIAFISSLLVSGCGGSPNSAGNSKWIDYGSGMVNVSMVKSLSVKERGNSVGTVSKFIKFDDFELTVASVNVASDPKDLPKLQAELDGQAKKSLERIRDFLKSSDTYLKL